MPFLDRGWPVLVDLSNTDMVYPSSCVSSSRSFIRAEPKVTVDFLRAYVAGIQLIKKDQRFAEKSFAKWMRKNAATIKKTKKPCAAV
jgi:ABC-type nitrate/sulfonate/bicarbonate transport system substrate-binding protein